MQEKRSVEVCFSPGLFQDALTTGDFIVVLVDILRATTTIFTAVANGVEEIIPVATHEEAGGSRRKDSYRVKRTASKSTSRISGIRPSASPGMRSGGKRLSTARPTVREPRRGEGREQHRIGAFVNISAVTEWLAAQQQNVVVLCSGWKNKFCLEDALFAGALTQRLLKTGLFHSDCDSANARWIFGTWPKAMC